jgi:hypothetical protein
MSTPLQEGTYTLQLNKGQGPTSGPTDRLRIAKARLT